MISPPQKLLPNDRPQFEARSAQQKDHPIDNELSTSDPTKHIHTIPRWFIGATGFIYITGYLIVATHLGRFGIRDAGGEFLKLKFIQVGMLFLLPYFALAAPIITLLFIALKRSPTIASPSKSPPPPAHLQPDTPDPATDHPRPTIRQTILVS